MRNQIYSLVQIGRSTCGLDASLLGESKFVNVAVHGILGAKNVSAFSFDQDRPMSASDQSGG
jgi:hypothetical protein